MNSITERPFWQFPWSYRENLLVVGGIILVGFLLQITLGNFNYYLLHTPVNNIVGVSFIGLITILTIFYRHTSFFQWLSGIPLSVTLIGALLALGIIMGLTPQYTKVDSNPHFHLTHSSWEDMLDFIFMKLGFTQMTSSWSFVLVYSFMLLCLGSLIGRRLANFKKSDYAFYFNHIGLWLFMFAAGLGASDMKRYVMHVPEGEVEWRVYDDDKNILSLPIAIQLNDFVMEEYPPKLAVINKHTGDIQPEDKPEYYQIDEKRPNAILAKWQLDMEEYIHEAVKSSDSTYKHVPMPGSMPAAKVSITDTETGKASEGWVSSGNTSQMYMLLHLDSTYCAVMTQPEPKRFASDITVVTSDEDIAERRAILEVNKPMKVGNWIIYQYGYDNQMGKSSLYSSFELVYDPWLPLSYLGIILFALGAVCMLWSGNSKDNKKS